MKYNHDRIKQAKRDAALVNACAVPIDQAIQIAVSSIVGTVFDAKLKEVDGRVVWRLKLLTPGGRVKAYVDGRTGRILEAKAEITVDEPQRSIMEDACLPVSLSNPQSPLR